MEPVSLKRRKTYEAQPTLKDDLSKIFVPFDITGLEGARETALNISYHQVKRDRFNSEREREGTLSVPKD